MSSRSPLDALLARIPQQRPFRFVDRLLSISETQVSGEYTFRHDESFYAGHFPGEPVTPGVILLEAMAQIGVVALGIHLLSLQEPAGAERIVPLFTSAQVEFERVIRPGETVRVEAERVFWRLRKLKVSAKLWRVLPSGELELAAHGVISGMAIAQPRPA